MKATYASVIGVKGNRDRESPKQYAVGSSTAEAMSASARRSNRLRRLQGRAQSIQRFMTHE